MNKFWDNKFWDIFDLIYEWLIIPRYKIKETRNMLKQKRIKKYETILDELRVKYGLSTYSDTHGLLANDNQYILMGIVYFDGSLYYKKNYFIDEDENLQCSSEYTKITSQKKIEKLLLECMRGLKEAKFKLKEQKIQNDFN